MEGGGEDEEGEAMSELDIAEACHAIGGTYSSMGQYDKASEYFEKDLLGVLMQGNL
eukprot:m.315762 g.315762  ORF g.315762 m.315762 type:complete len:56 (-) comp15975_c1_seq3:322-489(-)